MGESLIRQMVESLSSQVVEVKGVGARDTAHGARQKQRATKLESQEARKLESKGTLQNRRSKVAAWSHRALKGRYMKYAVADFMGERAKGGRSVSIKAYA
jgi:hypothetical protein